jgi:tetratricopeptide (TPR) repeat protein
MTPSSDSRAERIDTDARERKITNTMLCRFVPALNFTPSDRRFFAAIIIFFVSVFSPLRAVMAQSGSGGDDPRVQKLYGEAKQAEARGDIAGAVAKYESILQIAPRLGPAYNNLGALYLRMHDYPKAVEVLEKGLKVDPKMPSASALLGISLFQMAEYADARPRLEAALRANPTDENAELYLAKDLINLGENGAAEGHLHHLLQRQPKNQELWYLLGNVYMQLSEKAFARLDAINPHSVLSHELRGDIMSSMNNYPGALIEYKKAVELGSKEAGTHYKLGDAYWKLDEWGPATGEFNAELANDPANCEAQWKLGNILLQQHLDPQQALEDTNKALALCPSLTDARVDRARALLLLNRPADALPDLHIAEKADPDESVVHFLLSQAYRRVGQIKEATAEMEIFAKLEQSARAADANRAQQMLQLRNAGKPTPPK